MKACREKQLSAGAQLRSLKHHFGHKQLSSPELQTQGGGAQISAAAALSFPNQGMEYEMQITTWLSHTTFHSLHLLIQSSWY